MNNFLKIVIIILLLFAAFGFIFGITRFIAGDIATGIKVCGLALVGGACLVGAYLSKWRN